VRISKPLKQYSQFINEINRKLDNNLGINVKDHIWMIIQREITEILRTQIMRGLEYELKEELRSKYG
jgi:hypothetical protein